MLPNASDLAFFIEIATTQNMSRAAERLGVTQPTLSQAMKRLEFAFDKQLLVRSKSGVSLTKAGQKLHLKARALLNDWEALKLEATKDEQEVRGTYSIGTHPSVALFTLKYILPELLEGHPQFQVNLEHDLSRKITEKVISFKLDFGIVVNPVSHPDLVITELFKDQVIFCRAKKKSSLTQIEDGDAVLICEPDLSQTQELLKKSKKKNVYSRIVTTSSLEVVKSLILEGAGIGIIPSRVLGNDLKKVEILTDKGLPLYQDRICLVYRVDAQTSHSSKQIINKIKAVLKS